MFISITLKLKNLVFESLVILWYIAFKYDHHLYYKYICTTLINSFFYKMNSVNKKHVPRTMLDAGRQKRAMDCFSGVYMLRGEGLNIKHYLNKTHRKTHGKNIGYGIVNNKALWLQEFYLRGNDFYPDVSTREHGGRWNRDDSGKDVAQNSRVERTCSLWGMAAGQWYWSTAGIGVEDGLAPNSLGDKRKTKEKGWIQLLFTASGSSQVGIQQMKCLAGLCIPGWRQDLASWPDVVHTCDK